MKQLFLKRLPIIPLFLAAVGEPQAAAESWRIAIDKKQLHHDQNSYQPFDEHFNNSTETIDPNLSHFEEGSSLELARKAAIKLPVPDHVIDDEVRSFTAVADEVLYLTIEDGRSVNRVYSGTKLGDREQAKLDAFLQWVEEHELFLPAGFSDKHNMAIRYLDEEVPDFEQAYNCVIKYDEWLRNKLKPNLEGALENKQMLNFLQSGAIYGYQRDAYQRPIIVINMRRIMDQRLSFQDISSYFDVLLCYTIFNAMPQGQVEQYNIILDAKEVSLAEVQVKMIAQFIRKSNMYYKHRGARMYVININWVLGVVISSITTYLDPWQIEKTLFLSSDYQDVLHDQLGVEKLEKRYGGWLPDKRKEFFPPEYN